MEDGTGGERKIEDERMVRIIGARHEKLPKTKAAGRETPDEVETSFANQNSYRQTGRIRGF